MARKGFTIPVLIVLFVFLVTPASLLAYKAYDPSGFENLENNFQETSKNVADRAGLSDDNSQTSVNNTSESTEETTRRKIGVSSLWNPGQPRVGESVDFYILNNGDFESVTWTFGDGSSREGKRVSHTYSESGNYTVNVTVKGADGGIGWKTNIIQIGDLGQKPIPDITYSPENPRAQEVAKFTATGSTHPDGRIVDYRWNIGGVVKDGSRVEHTFGTEGRKTVVLTVTGSKGLNATRVEQIDVASRNILPIPEFKWQPRDPKVGENITFDASGSQDPDGNISSYSWSFGYGRYSNGSTREVEKFNSPGTYNVSLKVEDNLGKQTEITNQIEVTTNQPPNVAIDYNPQPAVVDEEVVFESLASDPDGRVVEHKWDFNRDGEFQESGREVARYFVTEGYRNVSLRAVDDQGAVNTTEIRVKVNSPE